MLFRLRNWLANNFRGFQYPRQEYIPRGASPNAPFIRWKYQMPWPQRLLILTVSITAIIACIPLLVISLVILYFVVQALFS